MINDHKRSEYQCQSTLIWTWLGEENYGNKRSYTSDFQGGQKKSTFSREICEPEKKHECILDREFSRHTWTFFYFEQGIENRVYT